MTYAAMAYSDSAAQTAVSSADSRELIILVYEKIFELENKIKDLELKK